MRPAEVIISHQNTDFDALGSMLAARRLYPGATVLVHGGLNRNVREFAALHEQELALADASRCDLSAVSRVIVVETSQLGRLGDVAELVERPGVETMLFDHHGTEPPAWVAHERYVCSGDGALSSTMAGILAERGIEPTATEATVLALGIHEDTGSLTYASTTVRDVEALAFCLRHGANQELIGGFLHTPLDADHRALLTTLIDASEQVELGGVAVLVAAARWPRYVDGVSTLASKITDLTDSPAMVMLVEMDGRVFAVGRSRTAAFDVAAVMAALGGGGHAQAASALVRDETLEGARARLGAALALGIAAGPRAADIMSSPPWFVDADGTIDEALAECRRRGTSGVPVASGGEMVGVVAREDMGRAIGHGLGHAPVRGIMSAEVAGLPPDATLADVQRVLLRGVGRLAVTRDGRDGPHPTADVLGIITRGDLLRALRDAPPGAPPKRPTDLGDRLRAMPGLERLWPAAASAADDAGVYLVGGAVRDLLLGEPSFDIDLAFEGDGIAFAERLAAALGGRMHAHEKFHTAVVLAGDLRVDVASARTEHYEYPAALPTVEHSSIRQDLHRRDFTINAMAVSLLPAEFGLLFDPYGGEGDLGRGIVRVLHNLSFIEDPTRIFRAIRYQNRYGFDMDGLTRQLARSCVEMGLVGDLSGARVRDELLAVLGEEEVAGALVSLDQLGLAGAVHPALDCGPESVAPGGASRPRPPPSCAGAAGLARPAGRDRARHPGRRAGRVAGAAAGAAPRRPGGGGRGRGAAAAGSRHWRRPLEPARIAELLAPHPAEVALMVVALEGPAAESAELYLAQLRDLRLDIDGDTLREQLGMPESPQVGTLLAELLRRRRNGELGGREEQLEAARELLAEVAG